MSRREDAPVEFDLPIGAFPSWAAEALTSGAWEETPHNQPCRDVYPTAGFAQVDGGWQLGDAG